MSADTPTAQALLVEPAPAWVAEMIPKRRIANISSPFTEIGSISTRSECEITDALFMHLGLPDYVGQSSIDPPVNTAIQAAPRSEFDALAGLADHWLPLLLRKLFSELNPEPYQPYNNISRIGWPLNTFVSDKAWVVDQFIPRFLAGGLPYLPGYVTKGGRRQVESLDKVREYLAIDPKTDSVVKMSVDRKEFKLPFLNSSLERHPTRCRDVFSYPVYNLITQVLDTQLHAVFGNYPTWHHDMERADAPNHWAYLTFDVSHFERSLWVVGDKLGDMVGHTYGRVKNAFYRETPFLCRGMTGKQVYLVRPNLKAGFIPQLGSGVSDVSLTGKLAMAVVYLEYLKVVRGYHDQAALDTLFAGGDDTVSINNFGDDNLLINRYGDKSPLDECVAFCGKYFPVTPEEQPLFLGRVLSRDRQRWELRPLSYVTHTWVRERAPRPPFTRYPWYAYMKRREVYRRNGPPEIDALFDYEDELIRLHGGSPPDIYTHGAREEALLKQEFPGAYTALDDADLAYVVFSEKDDYLLSPKSKVQLGEYLGVSGLLPSRAREVIKGSVASEWQKQLQF